jgi:hypothetical protein
VQQKEDRFSKKIVDQRDKVRHIPWPIDEEKVKI